MVEGIEDDPENYTRFYLLKRRDDVRVQEPITKTSLAFTVAHQPGTLVEALQILSTEKANLTRIQSRPVHGQPWHYVFHVDCQVSDAGMADRVLSGLSSHCSVVRELGRYHAAEE